MQNRLAELESRLNGAQLHCSESEDREDVGQSYDQAAWPIRVWHKHVQCSSGTMHQSMMPACYLGP